MTPSQLYLLGLHGGSLLLFFLAHGFRGRMTLAPALTLGALYTFLIWLVGQAAWWDEWGPLKINASHLAVTPTILAGGLAIYAMDGIQAGRAYVMAVVGTALFASFYLEFLAHLGEVVPLPNFIFQSLYSHLALAGALAVGLVVAILVYELARRILPWPLILPTGLASGMLLFLCVNSLVSYGR